MTAILKEKQTSQKTIKSLFESKFCECFPQIFIACLHSVDLIVKKYFLKIQASFRMRFISFRRKATVMIPFYSEKKFHFVNSLMTFAVNTPYLLSPSKNSRYVTGSADCLKKCNMSGCHYKFYSNKFRSF